jgi:hypothetical protein
MIGKVLSLVVGCLAMLSMAMTVRIMAMTCPYPTMTMTLLRSL